jgi:hypothetical protein
VEEEDFESSHNHHHLPITKNDPKYQTLPYNAKLFAPFANKQDQEQFEKSLQQMHILQQDHPHINSQSRQNQQQIHNHQQQQQQQQAFNNLQSYNNRANQLHHLLSQHKQQQQQQSNGHLPMVRPSNFVPTGGPASTPTINESPQVRKKHLLPSDYE